MLLSALCHVGKTDDAEIFVGHCYHQSHACTVTCVTIRITYICTPKNVHSHKTFPLPSPFPSLLPLISLTEYLAHETKEVMVWVIFGSYVCKVQGHAIHYLTDVTRVLTHSQAKRKTYLQSQSSKLP